jgi:DNA-binding GntR family transcriptional regulator
VQQAVHPGVSAPVEDYVKAIYALTLEPEQAASTSQIAERLGITAGSVSTMIKRMDASGLAEHVPYRGVRCSSCSWPRASTSPGRTCTATPMRSSTPPPMS